MRSSQINPLNKTLVLSSLLNFHEDYTVNSLLSKPIQEFEPLSNLIAMYIRTREKLLYLSFVMYSSGSLYHSLLQ